MGRDRKAAWDIAARAVEHVLAEPELIETLLGMTGAAPGDLRAMMDDGSLARACLDVVMERDERVLELARRQGLDPADIARAHAWLTGMPDS